MKTKEEIEKSAIDYAKTQVVRGNNLPEWDDKTEQLIARYFTKGYTQCQEDMVDKIETKWNEYRLVTNNEDAWLFKQWLISSLNKQD